MTSRFLLGVQFARHLDFRNKPDVEDYFVRSYPHEVVHNPTLRHEHVLRSVRGDVKTSHYEMAILLSLHPLTESERAPLVATLRSAQVLDALVKHQPVTPAEVRCIVHRVTARGHVGPAMAATLGYVVRHANALGLTKECRAQVLRFASPNVAIAELCASRVGDYLDDAPRWIHDFLDGRWYTGDARVVALLLTRRPDLVDAVFHFMDGRVLLRDVLFASGLVLDTGRQLALLDLTWTREHDPSSPEYRSAAYRWKQSLGRQLTRASVTSPFRTRDVVEHVANLYRVLGWTAPPAYVGESRADVISALRTFVASKDCFHPTKVVLSAYCAEFGESTPEAQQCREAADKAAVEVGRCLVPSKGGRATADYLRDQALQRFDDESDTDIVAGGAGRWTGVSGDARDARPAAVGWFERRLPSTVAAYQLLLALAPTWEGSAASLVETASLLS